MKKCRISFECDSNSAKVIVGLIIDKVSNLSMLELNDEHDNKPNGSSKNHSTAWVNKYAQPVVDFFKKRGGEIPHNDHELLATIQKAGLKATSISPLLSDLVDHGKLVRVRRGLYRLPS